MSNLTEQQEYINNWLMVIFSSISILCSLTAIWLILFLNKKNGYVLLIFSLCLSEIIYNSGFILSFYNHNLLCHVRYSLFFIGGLAVSMWINIISGVVLYMLYALRTLDIYSYYPYFTVYAWVLPILAAIFNFHNEFNWHCHDEMNEVSYAIGAAYSYARIVLVLVNMIIYGCIHRKVRNITKDNYDAISITNRAVVNVATRMKYYAFIHILFRILPTFTEIIEPNSYYIIVFLSSILTSSTGIGYFIVFVYMHPGAFVLFTSYFRCILFIEEDYRKSWIHSNNHSIASSSGHLHLPRKRLLSNRYVAIAQMNESLLHHDNRTQTTVKNPLSRGGREHAPIGGSDLPFNSNANQMHRDHVDGSETTDNTGDVCNDSNNSKFLSDLIDESLLSHHNTESGSRLSNESGGLDTTTFNSNPYINECDHHSVSSCLVGMEEGCEVDTADEKETETESEGGKESNFSDDENQLQALYEQEVAYHYIIEWDLLPLCCLDWLCCNCGNNGKSHTPYFEYLSDSEEEEEEYGYYLES